MHLQIIESILENDNNDWRGLANMLYGAILESRRAQVCVLKASRGLTD